MDKEALIAFEKEIEEIFNAGKIRAPIHLYHGNENEIINVSNTLYDSEDYKLTKVKKKKFNDSSK